MKAIILAAGVGKRLRPITDNIPKCLININGQFLIERYIKYLREFYVSEIVIVVGYRKDMVISSLHRKIHDIKFIYNPDYKKGNVTSLHMAKKELNCDCIIMDADVYFEKKVLNILLNSYYKNCFLIDSNYSKTGEEMVAGILNNRVVAIDRGLNGKFDLLGEGVGFIKLSAESAKKLQEILSNYIYNRRFKSEYEECLNELVKFYNFGYEKVNGLKWTEIDFESDIQIAEKIALNIS